MPIKTLNLLGQRFEIEGLSDEDPYFSVLNDHSDGDFGRLIRLFLPQDGTALDIGANIGLTACMLSAHLSDGKTLALEPNPTVFPLLNKNVSSNDLTNVQAINKGVGSKVGQLGFVGESAYGHLDRPHMSGPI